VRRSVSCTEHMSRYHDPTHEENPQSNCTSKRNRGLEAMRTWKRGRACQRQRERTSASEIRNVVIHGGTSPQEKLEEVVAFAPSLIRASSDGREMDLTTENPGVRRWTVLQKVETQAYPNRFLQLGSFGRGKWKRVGQPKCGEGIDRH